LWLNAVLPLAAMAVPAFVAILARQIIERRYATRAVRAAAALRVFQSPAIAARLADDPAFLSEPRRQQAAVVFIDLSGFTGASERLGAEGTQAMLKAFHTHVEEETTAHDGIVLNFMGDGAMLLFGLGSGGAADADHALAAAFGLSRRVGAWI